MMVKKSTAIESADLKGAKEAKPGPLRSALADCYNRIVKEQQVRAELAPPRERWADYTP